MENNPTLTKKKYNRFKNNHSTGKWEFDGIEEFDFDFKVPNSMEYKYELIETFKKPKWHEKHYLWSQIITGLITALLSLGVGWLLLQSEYHQKNREYKELQKQLEQVNKKVDSLTNLHTHKKDF